MSYRELIAELDREHAEALSDALLEVGALSVSVEDADAALARITAQAGGGDARIVVDQ